MERNMYSVAVRYTKIGIVGVLVLAGIFALLQARAIREPRASVETRFVELSEGGMQIVPASCPSQPDVPGGECNMPSNPPPDIPPIFCDFVASSYSIIVGQSTTLSWTAAPYNWSSSGGTLDQYRDSMYGIIYTPSFFLSSIGTVARTGSLSVSPLTTTNYTLSIEGANASYTYTRNCDVTITVSPAIPACPSGTVSVGGGKCIPNGQPNGACPPGYAPSPGSAQMYFVSSDTFVVPQYDSLTTQCWGGGGGGAGDRSETVGSSAGGASAFTTLSAGGGSGGKPGAAAVGLGGAGGVASGGTTNTSGNAGANSGPSNSGAGGSAPAGGGAGGAAVSTALNGNPGAVPGAGGSGGFNGVLNTYGGGGGGSGAFVSRAYTPGQLTVGNPIPVTVGVGGGYGSAGGYFGGMGAYGQCLVSWSGPTAACVYTGCPNICGSGANLNKVVNSCYPDQVVDDCPAHGQGWTCNAATCVPPPPPSISIAVQPRIIKFGATTQVVWSSQNVQSCAITEDNPIINDSGCGSGWCALSGNKQSSAITQATKYTLTCVPLSGGTIVKMATVNVAPKFREL